MKKIKLFIENFLIYGIGGVLNKLVPLIMVPVVTNILPDTEYFGISDMSNTMVQFFSALAIMGMYDAMYRLFFEKEEEEYQKTVCSTALSFTLLTSFFVFLLMLLLKDYMSDLFFHSREFSYVTYICAMATLIGATNSIVSAPTRMNNNRRVYLITNFVSSFLAYAISIPLLLKGYYIIALPLAGMISSLAVEITFVVINRKWFEFKRFDRKMLKQLLTIAIPLLPNFLIYWIFNSCDKIMITRFLGLGESGIYSVGSKLGHASQLIYTAFAGGWQYFAFSTMKEEGQVKSNSLVFEYLGALSFVSTAFVCAFSSLIFTYLFKPDYYTGYIVAPYLFFAPLLQMLYQVASNQFLVIKDTLPNMAILALGAFVNLVVNLVFIPKFGIEGAALATLFGYVFSVIACIIVLYKKDLINVSKRFVITSLMMTLYFIFWRRLFSEKFVIGFIFALIYTVLVIILYRKEFGFLFESVKQQLRKK